MGERGTTPAAGGRRGDWDSEGAGKRGRRWLQAKALPGGGRPRA